jgi:REP element-mobilizing transposase RayT
MIFPGNARLRPGLYYHSRGYLPHLDIPEAIQHVTYHLADSLPTEALERMKAGKCGQARAWRSKAEDHGSAIVSQCEEYLDAGYGSCILRIPAIAEMVQNSFLKFQGERYRLFAWVVMPNHVHVLFRPLEGWLLTRIVASWKSFTGKRIADFIRSTGQAGAWRSGIGNDGWSGAWDSGGQTEARHLRVWHREYWDRFIRSVEHYQTLIYYIHENPVKAGLVKKAEDWQWSSAQYGTFSD